MYPTRVSITSRPTSLVSRPGTAVILTAFFSPSFTEIKPLVPKKWVGDCNAFMCCICWPTPYESKFSLTYLQYTQLVPWLLPQCCSAGWKCEKLCATDGSWHAHFPSACFLPLLILKRKTPAKSFWFCSFFLSFFKFFFGGKRLVGLKEFWNKNVCFLLLHWLSLLSMEFRSSGNFVFDFDTKVSPSLISFPFSLSLIAIYWWEWNSEPVPMWGEYRNQVLSVSALMAHKMSWRNRWAAKTRQFVWIYRISWGRAQSSQDLPLKMVTQTKKESMFIKARKGWWIY